MQLFFIKHGQTLSEYMDRLPVGDQGLSKAGEEEAIRAAEALRCMLEHISLARIICSPRRRTVDAATIIAGVLGFEMDNIEQDTRLLERDCSPYQGQIISKVFSKSEEELVSGGMEPMLALYSRSKELIDELLTEGSEGAVLLVGHSGNIAPLEKAAGATAPTKKTNTPLVDSASVIRLR